jgi:hypothetical protein
MAQVIFQRVANGFSVTASGNTTTVSMSDIPLTFVNVGLAAQGYTQTQILQLAQGQQITVTV